MPWTPGVDERHSRSFGLSPCSRRTNHQPLVTAYRTSAEDALKRCGVGEHAGDPLHITSPVKGSAFGKTGIAVVIASTTEQHVSDLVHRIHDIPPPRHVCRTSFIGRPLAGCCDISVSNTRAPVAYSGSKRARPHLRASFASR